MNTGKRSLYVIVLVVSVSSFVTLLNVHSINVALSTMASEFGITKAQVALVPQSYLFALSSLMLLVGKLADRFNPKRMFQIGLLLFMITSLLCGLSTRFEVLIAWRALQGGSAAIMQAVGTLILVRTVPAEYRGKAFGINGMFSSMGLLLGAPLGGLLTSWLGWPWAFLLSTPVCALCFFLVIWLPDIPPIEGASPKGRIDIRGALLSFGSLALLMYGCNRLLTEGGGEPIVWVLLGVGGLLGGWLWHHLRHTENPILDLHLFYNKPFFASLIIILVANLILTGNNFVIPFYLHQQLHLEVNQVGFLFLFFSIAYLVISPLAGQLVDRYSARTTLRLGIMVCVIAYVFFISLLQSQSSWFVSFFLFLLGGGLSLLMIAGNVFSFENITSDKVGEATALYRLLGLVGALTGVSLFSTLLTVKALVDVDILFPYYCVYGVSAALVGGIFIFIPKRKQTTI